MSIQGPWLLGKLLALSPRSVIPAFAAAIIFGWLALAMIAARLLGAFRRRSIVGPPRLQAGESVWSLVFVFFGGACMAVFLGGIANRFVSPEVRKNLILESAIIEGLAFVCIVIFARMFRSQGIKMLGLRPLQIPRGIALGGTALFILFPMVSIVSAMTELVLNWFRLPTPTHEVLQALHEDQHGPKFMITIALAVIGAPLAEELAFRGFLQTVIAQGIGWLGNTNSNASALSPTPRTRWAAVLITAAIFAAVHHEIAFFPPLFVLAIGLGYLYERTGNLWAAISTHAIFNGIQILLFLGVASR